MLTRSTREFDSRGDHTPRQAPVQVFLQGHTGTMFTTDTKTESGLDTSLCMGRHPSWDVHDV
ncbi:hypothetical protein GN958_ATG01972 [Phytophthora infestans]|uniref:Uncharacterized protein n=1 Tax=Phytophthora infestans TaxID=4787 RepID=A0A8S9VBR1_PHYIN|nr:hypothetical protein GN958_ATG01972 [Phytophthora infestans]